MLNNYTSKGFVEINSGAAICGTGFTTPGSRVRGPVTHWPMIATSIGNSPVEF